MAEPNFLTVIAEDGRDLLTAARSDWSRPIPHCPDWDAGELVGHMGGILDWIAKIVSSGERVRMRERAVPPAERGELAGWYSAQLDHALDVLAAADPGATTWTFSTLGADRVDWWRRRLAVELAIHRWDAQHAASLGGAAAPRPLDGEVAAAGVAEFLTEFLPGLLAQPTVEGLTGTLHLHATDGACEWWVDLDAGADAVAVAKHAKGDTAVRGTRSDLLLWLTNREPAEPLDVIGRAETAAQWTQLRR